MAPSVMGTPSEADRKARRTTVLALVHAALALLILAGFVFVRVHHG